MDETTPLTGKLLGARYRVGAKLGAGGMGAVYEGVQEGLDRKVALKVLHPHLAGEKELLERFQREAHIVAGLGHPNVVQISDFQTPPGEPPFLVMELLQGENLRAALKRTPQLPQARVAYIAMQVLSALDAAHRAQVVHRDIKPDNIFLVRTNVQADIVKVLDFGVAKLLGGEEWSNRLTRQGFVVGTLSYMAPEQASSEGVDGRSDLYALGACMYVALAGRKPFEAATTTDLLRAILSEPPVPLTAIRQDIDEALWRVIARALAKKKEDRFASAAEMARALAPFAKPTTPEAAASSKSTVGEADSEPVPTQPTAAQTPRALGSEPTPEPATLPDDSSEWHAPHTAPLPTHRGVMEAVPVTQPMTAMEMPRFEQTARLPGPMGGARPWMVQPLPPHAAKAAARRRRLEPHARAERGTGRKRQLVPWIAAFGAIVVAGMGLLFSPFSPLWSRASVTGSAPPPTAPTRNVSAASSAVREPPICKTARDMHEHGQTEAATRLAAQCVAQGGQAPF